MTDGHDDRILGYLNGSLPAEETARLDEALKSDPALGARFARLALLENLLPELAADESPEIEILEPLPSKRPRLLLPRPATRRARGPVRTMPLPWGKIAAALLLGVALLFFLTRRPEPQPEAPPVEARKPEAAAPVPEPERPQPPAPVPPVEAPVISPTPPPVPAPATPAPLPTPPPPPVEDTTKRVLSQTAAPAWATVQRVEGSVTLVTATGRSPVALGAELRAGDGLETAGASAAVAFRYPDGTVIETQADTSIADVGRAGRTLLLTRGSIAANVAPQPAGTSFVVQTPQADVTVIGTRFSLSVTAAATRLEVREGRVRFLRKNDPKAVDVSAGQVAVADLRPPALFRFDFEDGRRPELWDGGVVEAGPKRDGNKFCLNADKLSVSLGARKPLALRYSENLVLGFDYWVAPAGHRLSIRLVNGSQTLTHTFMVLKPPGETWSRFSMPLKDMFGDSARLFREGDRIPSITIFVEPRPQAALYVDNLDITEKKK